MSLRQVITTELILILNGVILIAIKSANGHDFQITIALQHFFLLFNDFSQQVGQHGLRPLALAFQMSHNGR